MKKIIKYSRDYEYVHGGDVFSGPQRYSSERDNILSIIGKQCIDNFPSGFLWYENGLFKISKSEKSISYNDYSRIINIESMSNNHKIPTGLLTILEKNGFKELKTVKKS